MRQRKRKMRKVFSWRLAGVSVLPFNLCSVALMTALIYSALVLCTCHRHQQQQQQQSFDDEPEWIINSTQKPSMSSSANSVNSTTTTSRLISLEASSQLEPSQHLDDLLAIESEPLAAKLTARHQTNNIPSPPYELQNNTQLFKLQRAPSTPPIYLRHALPASLLLQAQPPAAFQHPAAIRKAQAEVVNYPPAPPPPPTVISNQNGTFALLPSWPSVYIAQRESQAVVSGDPKVPINYPDWSSHSNRQTIKLTPPAAAGDSQQIEQVTNGQQVVERPLKRVNLSASEVEYEEEEPARVQFTPDRVNTTDWAQLLRQAARTNVMESLMLTNKSIVSLLCDTNNMFVRFKFKHPFRGLVETNLEPRQKCRLFGNGSRFYELRIDLNDCGTRQEMPRLYINNLQIYYQHPYQSASSVSFNERQLKLADEVTTTNQQQQQQQQETKTIICSYPVRDSTSKTTSDQSELKGNAANEQQVSDRQIPVVKLSDRIVESPPREDDPQTPAKLLYYEPALLISGLVLLAVATTLALLSSAYIVRKRRGRNFAALTSSSSQLTSSSMSPPPTRGNGGGGGGGGNQHIYERSPAQAANQRRRRHRFAAMAPPLIGLSKEESLVARPVAKQYPRRPANRPTSPAVLRNKQINSARRANIVPSKANKSGSSSERSTGDSLDSAANRRQDDQSSVTTIEIPFVAPVVSLVPAGNQTTSTTQTLKKRERDEAVQTVQIKPEEARKVSREYQREEKRSHEKLTEITYQQPQQKSQQQQLQKVNVEHKRLRGPSNSPLPFGSFRAKLTSPSEFKRLQDVLKLLQNDDHLSISNQSLEGSWDYSRLRSRISRTISEPERRRLVAMLQDDEVFRSHIVDSIDRDKFQRKLRHNPNYSGKFSTATWDLLEDILLKVNIGQILSGVQQQQTQPVKSSKPERQSTTNLQQSQQVKDTSQRREVGTSNQHSDDDDDNIKTVVANDKIRENDDAIAKNESTIAANLSDDSIGAFKVSQSSSTSAKRDDGNTLINIDSVTNISTPRNFTAYTRSSFQQITKYQEIADDSLPYMDEGNSHTSTDSQASSSNEHRQRAKQQQQRR